MYKYFFSSLELKTWFSPLHSRELRPSIQAKTVQKIVIYYLQHEFTAESFQSEIFKNATSSSKSR